MTSNSATDNAGVAAAREQFETLLRELFQFDCADLDFGIYRIMNHKREVIDEFIREKLPAAVEEAVNKGALAEQEQAAQDLVGLKEGIVDAYGSEALRDDSILAPFEGSKRVQRYRAAQRLATEGRNRVAVETDIYNRLYAFFRRYYQDGDFISRRRYSRNQRYAIPYNGEEVHLHWANRDQYYVKTDKHFRNYDWRAPDGVAVQFRMRNANVEQNNVNGEARFFLPRAKKLAWDADARVLTIPFEYRPLTQSEKVEYGNQKQQSKIIAVAIEAIPAGLSQHPEAAAALTGEHRRNSAGEPVSRLEHHLIRYASRNSADFFVHKDLRGFLNQELDFYLKNEVLNLEDLTRAGTEASEGWFQSLRLLKSVGGEIIDFLAQIEGFQKLLWEKRKFVTQVHYCITLGCIDPSFYPEIAANDAQWQEWRELYALADDRNPDFLQDHPALTVDTAHFDAAFTDRLLASFDDLDALTDGLLIHSENWQALNLLQEKYRGRIKCIYIDPLYNTGKDDFLYKDSYQHSTWLSMMDSLMPASLHLLSNTGSFVSHIDEHEFNRFDQLISMRFGAEQNIGPIIWDKRNPKGDATTIATQHEYICWAVKDYNAFSGDKHRLSRKKENAHAIISKAAELVRLNGGVSDKVRDKFKSWLDKQNFSAGEKAYSNIDDNQAVYRSVSMAWPNTKPAPEEYRKPLIHPITGKPCPVPAHGWRNSPEKMKNLLAQDLILFGPDETTQPTRKYLLRDNMSENVPSLYYFGGSDADLQSNMGYSFPTAKSIRLGDYVIDIAASDSDSIVVDYFAGSGTTGHAVINLNREDGGQRKFVLVEMGEYFDSVLLTRIKKVIYAPEWRKGKPHRLTTAEEAERSPRIIKYLRLESYEDALDSIEFDPVASQLRLDKKFPDYLLKYMLQWETKGSETLLNPSKLTRPFTYRLGVHLNGDRSERTVDLAETFNYLLGLNVRARRVLYDDENGGSRRYLVYRGTTRARPQEEVALIWRETDGWKEDDFARDRDFVKEQGLTDGADVVYINGDGCGILKARAVEPLFKARMFPTEGR